MKIRNATALLALVLASFLLGGCNEEPLKENMHHVDGHVMKPVNDLAGEDNRVEIIIENVVRVFFHEPPNHFSVFSLGTNKNLVFHDIRASRTEVKILMDVSEDKPMWVVYKDATTERSIKDVEIHINSPHDINGAGWVEKRGKSTVRGTTVEIK